MKGKRKSTDKKGAKDLPTRPLAGSMAGKVKGGVSQAEKRLDESRAQKARDLAG